MYVKNIVYLEKSFFMILRKTYLDKIEKSFKSVPIIVLIGARQVGKTSLMKSFNFKGETLFLNGQNSEIAEIFQSYSNT